MFFLTRHPLIYSPFYHPKLHTRNAVIREFGIRETRYANYRVAVGLLGGQGWGATATYPA